MASYSKAKYKHVEFNHYELQMLASIMQETYPQEGDWFTEQNLNDLKELINNEISKLN